MLSPSAAPPVPAPAPDVRFCASACPAMTSRRLLRFNRALAVQSFGKVERGPVGTAGTAGSFGSFAPMLGGLASVAPCSGSTTSFRVRTHAEVLSREQLSSIVRRDFAVTICRLMAVIPPDSRVAAESCPDSEEHRVWGENLKRKRGNQKFDGGRQRIRSLEHLPVLDFFDFC
jgi:hypothetical protein